MEYLGWLFTGLLLGGAATYFATSRFRHFATYDSDDEQTVTGLLRSHFRPLTMDQITISERQFPFRASLNVAHGIDGSFETSSFRQRTQPSHSIPRWTHNSRSGMGTGTTPFRTNSAMKIDRPFQPPQTE